MPESGNSNRRFNTTLEKRPGPQNYNRNSYWPLQHDIFIVADEPTFILYSGGYVLWAMLQKQLTQIP